MRRLKKIATWFTIGFGALLVLSVILLLLLPHFVNQDYFKKIIVKRTSEKLGWTGKYEQLNLSFFPSPRLVVRQGEINITPEASAQFESLDIYLSPFPLLTGKVAVKEIRFESPQFLVRVPEIPMGQKENKASDLLRLFFGTFMPGLKEITDAIVPDQQFSIDNGKVVYVQGAKTVFTVRDLNSEIEAGEGDITLFFECASNIGDKIVFQVTANRSEYDISGKIGIQGFKPQTIMDTVSTDTDFRIGDSKIDLDLAFKSETSETLALDLNGTIPFLHLLRGDKAITLEGNQLSAKVRLTPDGVTANLASLTLESPRLSLSGDMKMNMAGGDIRLTCKGKEIDVASLRKAVLDIYGDQTGVGDVFDTIKSGHVPYVTATLTGPRFAALGHPDNIVIEGRMEDGDIYIAPADMALTAVNGNALISKGILKGSKLSARYGNSKGKDGTLLLGLRRGDNRFSLDIGVEADISQLPPVLNRYIENAAFRKELSLVEDVKGSGRGRLILANGKAGFKTEVQVSGFDFDARYGRVPFPLKFQGEGFLFKENRIVIKDTTSRFKSSHISKINATIDMGAKPSLSLNFGSTNLAAEEVYPWLTTYEVFSSALKSVPDVNGVVTVDNGDIRGDLYHPSRWQIQAAGGVQKLRLGMAELGDDLHITGGRFKADRNAVAVQNLRVKAMDAEGTITGVVGGYLTGPSSGDLKLSGICGIRASNWISNRIRLPSQLVPHQAMALENVAVGWSKSDDIRFNGSLKAGDGPTVYLDVQRTSDALIIPRLHISDDVSDAGFRIRLESDTCDLSFNGNLKKATVDKLLRNNALIEGWVAGDFNARLQLDQPVKSTVSGILKAQAIRLPSTPLGPVRINAIDLNSQKNRVQLNRANVDLEGRHLEIMGQVRYVPSGVHLDIDLVTDGIDWDKFSNSYLKKEKNKDPGQQTDAWNLPITGVIRMKSDFFRYGSYTWNPVRADITLKPFGADIRVIEAVLCGISTPGTFQVLPTGVKLNFDTLSHAKSLEYALSCLFNKVWLADGVFNYGGRLTAHTFGPFAVQALKGDMAFDAKNGRIYRFGMLAKIFEIINVAEFLKLKLPDLNTEGFHYTTITANWHLDNGKLELKNGIIESPSAEIIAEGTIDVVDQTIDMRVLVAPLQTANLIIKNIPVVRDIMAGSMVSIPFKVSGKLKDPTVVPLHPGSVGKGLMNLMGRTLKAPYKLIQPLISSDEKQTDKEKGKKP